MLNKREFDLAIRSISHEVDSSKVKKIDQNGKKKHLTMSVVGGAKTVHCKESTCATGIQRQKGFADHFKETSILISKHSRKHLKLCQMAHACHHRTSENETRKQLQVQGLSRLHG